MAVFALDRFPVVLDRNPSATDLPQKLPQGFLGSTFGLLVGYGRLGGEYDHHGPHE